MNTVVSLDEFRKNLSDIVSKVMYGNQVIRVQKHRKKGVIVISEKEYDFLKDPRKSMDSIEKTITDEPTIAKIKQKTLPLLLQANAKKAAIFGSYARNEQTAESDIDIVVDLPTNTTLIDVIGLKLQLEDALQKKVDLVEYKGLKPRVRDTILSQQTPIL